MSRTGKLMMVAVPLALVAAACGKRASTTDSGLANDLSLAAQTYAPQQLVSPAEQVKSPYNPYGAPASAPRQVAARAPAQRTPAPVPRTTPSSSSSASSSSASSGSGTIYRAPEPVVVKNTRRDAAIGAAAGAVIGAATSRDKVKGGLIGAAVGGVLGGVIGNNVDIKRKY